MTTFKTPLFVWPFSDVQAETLDKMTAVRESVEQHIADYVPLIVLERLAKWGVDVELRTGYRDDKYFGLRVQFVSKDIQTVVILTNAVADIFEDRTGNHDIRALLLDNIKSAII